jgi:hypothetical protein
MIFLPLLMGSSPRPEFRRDDESTNPRPAAYHPGLHDDDMAPPSYATVIRELGNSENSTNSPSYLEAGAQEHALFLQRPTATAQRGTRLRDLHFTLPRVAAPRAARSANAHHANIQGR